jgi:hypothetical protein
MGKGKVHYIEVLSDEEEDGDDETTHIQDSGQRSGEPPHLEITEEKSLQEGQESDHCHTFRSPQILHLQGQRHFVGAESYNID